MSPKNTHPPITAREILAAFFVPHEWHTIVSCTVTPRTAVIKCDCGVSELKLYSHEAKYLNWTFEQVKHALRNVPAPYL